MTALRDGNQYSPDLTSEPIVAADPNFDLGSKGDNSERAAPSVKIDIIDSRMQEISELTSTVPHFHRLMGTRVEGELIASLLNVTPLLDNEVLDSRIKRCKSPRVLHIATQAYFLPTHPDNSTGF